MIRSERNVLIISIFVMATFFLCVLFAQKAFQSDVPKCVPVSTLPYSRGKVVQLLNNHYQVYYVAGMWQFDPVQVTLPVGSTVDLYLTSKDVVHGFDIYEKNVNMMAVYGAVNLTTVHFDHTGEYIIRCHEYCGVGHQFMQGKIIVK